MSLSSIWHFYSDGFRHMTWGRTMWIIILLKLFILFVILRVFFFKPAMEGMDDDEKSSTVATQLLDKNNN